MPGGRPPKPTTQIKLHGTHRSDRRHADEPVPEVCIPKKPVFLKGAAAKEWKRITVELHEQKLLSEMDLATLAGYCHAYGEVIRLDKEIRRIKKDMGLCDLIPGAKGGWVANPLLRARNSAWELVLKFGREFGLSPVARTRISVGGADAENEFAAFQKQYA